MEEKEGMVIGLIVGVLEMGISLYFLIAIFANG